MANISSPLERRMPLLHHDFRRLLDTLDQLNPVQIEDPQTKIRDLRRRTEAISEIEARTSASFAFLSTPTGAAPSPCLVDEKVASARVRSNVEMELEAMPSTLLLVEEGGRLYRASVCDGALARSGLPAAIMVIQSADDAHASSCDIKPAADVGHDPQSDTLGTKRSSGYHLQPFLEARNEAIGRVLRQAPTETMNALADSTVLSIDINEPSFQANFRSRKS